MNAKLETRAAQILAPAAAAAAHLATGSAQLSQGRSAGAFAVAALAEVVQLPLKVLGFTGFLAVPSDVADLGVGCGR